MTTVEQAIHQRHSVRSFIEKPVNKEDIKAILNAGCQAPSSKNDQPWNVIVVEQPALGRIMNEIKCKSEIADKTMSILSSAPVGLFIIMDRGIGSERYLAHIQSIGALMENMMLEAVSLGLGSLWCGDILYCQEKLQKALQIDMPPVAALAIGYEKDQSPRRKHKTIDELVKKWMCD